MIREKILIAVGGRPWVPEFDGSEHVITSDEAFHLEQLPERVVMVGPGSPAGLLRRDAQLRSQRIHQSGRARGHGNGEHGQGCREQNGAVEGGRFAYRGHYGKSPQSSTGVWAFGTLRRPKREFSVRRPRATLPLELQWRGAKR